MQLENLKTPRNSADKQNFPVSRSLKFATHILLALGSEKRKHLDFIQAALLSSRFSTRRHTHHRMQGRKHEAIPSGIHVKFFIKNSYHSPGIWSARPPCHFVFTLKVETTLRNVFYIMHFIYLFKLSELSIKIDNLISILFLWHYVLIT